MLVCFDLDGTLVNSVEDLAAGLNFMRASFGLAPLTTDEVAGIIGDGIRVLVKRALGNADVDLSLAVAEMQRYYTAHLTDMTRLYPGVKEGLQKLSGDGAELAVITNKNCGEAVKILQTLGVADMFSEIIGGDSGYGLKPEPDALLALRQKYAVSEKCCWMVGDHYTDLESGRRAGFRRIFCAYGFGECREETPDFSVDSFAQIADIVEKF